MKRRRTQADVNSLAEDFLERVDPRGKRHAAVAATSWGRAAGPDIAKHTLGMAVREGELLVYVDSPTWANELSLMSDELKERLNAEIGKDLVESIRFTVSRQVRKEKEQDAVETEGAPGGEPPAEPLTEAERSQVDFVTKSIEDEALREAAVRAMTRSLEWKKGAEARNGRQSDDK